MQMMEQSSCGTGTLELSGIGLTNGEKIAEDRKVGVHSVERENKMMEHLPPRKGRSEGSRKRRRDIKMYKDGKQDYENYVCQGVV